MGPRRKKLGDYRADELLTLDYQQVLRLRKEAYAEHVAEVKVPASVKAWAKRMAKLHGENGQDLEEVKVWHNYLPWVEALLVVRYGEDPMQWPTEFTEADEQRAQQWENGSMPAGVSYV